MIKFLCKSEDLDHIGESADKGRNLDIGKANQCLLCGRSNKAKMRTNIEA